MLTVAGFDGFDKHVRALGIAVDCAIEGWWPPLSLYPQVKTSVLARPHVSNKSARDWWNRNQHRCSAAARGSTTRLSIPDDKALGVVGRRSLASLRLLYGEHRPNKCAIVPSVIDNIPAAIFDPQPFKAKFLAVQGGDPIHKIPVLGSVQYGRTRRVGN
jgi:hypothetical protein